MLAGRLGVDYIFYYLPYRSDLFVSGTTHGPGNLMTLRVNKKVTIRFVLRHNGVVQIIYFSATAQYPHLASHLTPNWSLCSCHQLSNEIITPGYLKDVVNEKIIMSQTENILEILGQNNA